MRSPKKILIGGLSLGRESGNVGGSCEWEQGVVGGVEIGSIEWRVGRSQNLGESSEGIGYTGRV